MSMKKSGVALAAALGLAAVATPAMSYEAGDIIVRARVISVNPEDDSGSVKVNGASVAGSGVSANSDVVPELDFTYMLTRNWGLELILAYSDHDVKATGTLNSLSKVASAKALPPTLTLQYHFAPDSNIRPYIGAGVNYTYYFDEEVEGALDISGSSAKLEDSWGLAAQVGVDVDIDETWFVNFDVKYIDMDTDATLKGTAAGTVKVNVDIDPIVWGIGIGRRF